jgi:hypothetical protein
MSPPNSNLATPYKQLQLCLYNFLWIIIMSIPMYNFEKNHISAINYNHQHGFKFCHYICQIEKS